MSSFSSSSSSAAAATLRGSNYFRVRILVDTDDISLLPECLSLQKSLYLIDAHVLKSVADLRFELINRLGIESIDILKRLQLSLNGFVVSPCESINVFRDDDLITLNLCPIFLDKFELTGDMKKTKLKRSILSLEDSCIESSSLKKTKNKLGNIQPRTTPVILSTMCDKNDLLVNEEESYNGHSVLSTKDNSMILYHKDNNDIYRGYDLNEINQISSVSTTCSPTTIDTTITINNSQEESDLVFIDKTKSSPPFVHCSTPLQTLGSEINVSDPFTLSIGDVLLYHTLYLCEEKFEPVLSSHEFKVIFKNTLALFYDNI